MLLAMSLTVDSSFCHYLLMFFLGNQFDVYCSVKQGFFSFSNQSKLSKYLLLPDLLNLRLDFCLFFSDSKWLKYFSHRYLSWLNGNLSFWTKKMALTGKPKNKCMSNHLEYLMFLFHVNFKRHTWATRTCVSHNQYIISYKIWVIQVIAQMVLYIFCCLIY